MHVFALTLFASVVKIALALPVTSSTPKGQTMHHHVGLLWNQGQSIRSPHDPALESVSFQIAMEDAKRADASRLRDRSMEQVFSELFGDYPSDGENLIAAPHYSPSRQAMLPSTTTEVVRKERFHVGSKRWERQKRGDKFREEWERKRLGTHLEPEELAQGVSKMRASGLDPKVVSSIAGRIVDSEKGPDYSTRYKAEIGRLGSRIRYNRKSLLKRPVLSPIEVERAALAKALRPIYSRERDFVNQPLKVKPSTQALIDARRDKGKKLLESFQSHLDTKKLDLASSPPDVLESETRDMNLDHVEARELYVYLKKYLQEQRNVPAVDLIALSKKRALILDRNNDRRHRERKRQKKAEPSQLSVVSSNE